jgi:DNA polymerase-4
VADLAGKSLPDLVTLAGRAHGTGLHRLARAEDDRPVVAEREAKSVSQESTFERDLTDLAELGRLIDSMAARVGDRLRASALSGRTVTLKLRRYDFTTTTRSQTLPQPTDDARQVASIARRLLAEAGHGGGLRLVGVGVSGLSQYAQGDLFGEVPAPEEAAVDPAVAEEPAEPEPPADRRWWPGQDVVHDELGPGWVWGRGLGRVTVRFEGPRTPPGPVRTLAADDPALHPGDPPDWRPATMEP